MFLEWTLLNYTVPKAIKFIFISENAAKCFWI